MRTLAIAVGTLFTAIAPAAFAENYARAVDSTPVQASDSTRQECWNPRAGHYEELRAPHETHVGKGAAIGAVAGGVLGHQVGSGRGNTAATVGGAVLGGVAGHQIEKRNDRDDQPDLDKSRCRYVSTR